MAKLTKEELLDAFKEMTLIELSEFVKLFEETFDVTAAAPVAAVVPGAPAAGGGDAGAAEEADSGKVDVILTSGWRQEDRCHQGGAHLTSRRPEGRQGSGGVRSEACSRAG